MPVRKGPLRIAIEDFLFGAIPGATTIIAGTAVVKSMERALARDLRPFYDEFLRDAPLPSSIKGIVDRAFAVEGPGFIIVLAIVGAVVGFAGALGITPPIARRVSYWVDKLIRSGRLTPAEYIAADRRDPDILQGIDDSLTDLGLPDPEIAALRAITLRRLSDGDLVEAFYRFPDERPTIEAEFDKRGWDQDHKAWALSLGVFLPPVTDLVRFALRDVFNPAIVERFQYDDGFDTFPSELAAKQGISEDTGRMYWRAHWVLPSTELGFEMFHRLRPGRTDDPFTEDDLRLLMRANDVPAFYRSKLLQLAYRLPRLVDARRMVEVGKWKAPEITEFFHDYGYDPKFIPDLVEFYTRDVQSHSRDLTQAAILKAYKQGIYDRQQAKSGIVGLGYDELEAETLLRLVDADMQAEVIQHELDRVEFLYVNKEIDDNGVVEDLSRVGMASERITANLEIWRVKRAKNAKLSTQNELEDFYELDIIPRAQYKSGLDDLGFNEKRVKWLLERTDKQLQIKRQAELDKESERQERLRRAGVQDQYQLDKANLDVEVATRRAEIADLKTLLNGDLSADQQQQVEDTIGEVALEIVGLNVQKATLRRDALRVALGGSVTGG